MEQSPSPGKEAMWHPLSVCLSVSKICLIIKGQLAGACPSSFLPLRRRCWHIMAHSCWLWLKLYQNQPKFSRWFKRWVYSLCDPGINVADPQAVPFLGHTLWDDGGIFHRLCCRRHVYPGRGRRDLGLTVPKMFITDKIEYVNIDQY